MTTGGTAARLLVASLLVAGAASADKSDKKEKIATLVSSDGKVTVGGASLGDGASIVAGSQVAAGEDAHAEVKVGDAALSVAPQTVLYAFGKAPPKGAKKLVVSEATTLASGVVRVATQKALAIDTPAGKVTFEPSTEAKLHVEAGATRISVHKGSAKAGGTTISEGFGARLGKGKPKPLPSAPSWTALPKPSLSTTGDAPVDVTAILGGTATRWHLQVALDGGFTQFLTDAVLEAKSTTLVMEQKLPPGRFHMRVSALDADGLEGPWSAVATTQITSKTK